MRSLSAKNRGGEGSMRTATYVPAALPPSLSCVLIEGAMSTRHQIAEEIAALMPAIARRVLLEFFQTVDITQTQIFTVMTLAEEAPCPLSTLSRKLHITAPTVTGIVDRLEKLGYVRRAADTKDRRVVQVDLTPRGKKLAGRLKVTIKEKWAELLTALPQKDQENYVRILRKIYGGLP
jgi:DNA-binding MarR family transcriptional regulator